jgi:hypothetical protein
MFGKVAFLAVAAAATLAAHGFEEVPRAAAKALRVTRGKPFSEGLVFVNGKYMEPPYVVERWGTGIRINSTPVTGQVIDWSEFLKTQDPNNVAKTTSAESAPEPAPAYTPAPAAKSDADMLDDLFDDNPQPRKASSSSSSYRAPAAKPRAPVTRYELVGQFVKNDAAKALVKRINDHRTEIDGILRRGGVIFFGDGYSRVAGDARTVEKMLERLPEIMQEAESLNAFRSEVRLAGMVYINEILSGQLYANKIDYRRLMERRQKLKNDREWSNLLKEVKKPLL